jgi:CheY-like chemotaxis protein
MRNVMTQQALQIRIPVATHRCTPAQVMVVDDDPHFRSLARHLLEPIGITVIEASGAREGLHCMYAHKIDLVVLDVVLPGEDGLKALIFLKANFPDTKILLATGLYLEFATPLGADAFLAKSEIERLRPLVEQLLETPHNDDNAA